MLPTPQGSTLSKSAGTPHHTNSVPVSIITAKGETQPPPEGSVRLWVCRGLPGCTLAPYTANLGHRRLCHATAYRKGVSPLTANPGTVYRKGGDTLNHKPLSPLTANRGTFYRRGCTYYRKGSTLFRKPSDTIVLCLSTNPNHCCFIHIRNS